MHYPEQVLNKHYTQRIHYTHPPSHMNYQLCNIRKKLFSNFWETEISVEKTTVIKSSGSSPITSKLDHL